MNVMSGLDSDLIKLEMWVVEKTNLDFWVMMAGYKYLILDLINLRLISYLAKCLFEY